MSTNYEGAIKISKSQNFCNRIEYSMFEVAEGVLKEAGSVNYHAKRADLARRVYDSAELPSVVATMAKAVCVGNLGILDPDSKDPDSPHGVTDVQIKAGVGAKWNYVAGIDEATDTA